MKTEILIVLLFAVLAAGQAQKAASNSSALPRPAMEPAAGTWKYKGMYGGYPWTGSTTIKDDGNVWTVTSESVFPDGPVTDVSTLEKGTLILRKESFKHFPHLDQPWKPVTINLDFTGNKVSGMTTNARGQSQPFTVALSGPMFASEDGADITIGCLPLMEGYSASFRTFDIVKHKEDVLQLNVVGTERVTVPAGTFDSYKVELASSGADSYKQTVWIAKDSRKPVKSYEADVLGKGTMITTTEMVPSRP